MMQFSSFNSYRKLCYFLFILCCSGMTTKYDLTFLLFNVWWWYEVKSRTGFSTSLTLLNFTLSLSCKKKKTNNIFLLFLTDFRNSGSCLNIPDVALSKTLTNSPFSNQMSSSTTRDTILSMSHHYNQLDTTDNSIMHPPQTTIYNRNGINFNRGLSFLRNAIFGHGITTSKINNGATCDAKDYKILNHSINTQSDQYVHPLQKNLNSVN